MSTKYLSYNEAVDFLVDNNYKVKRGASLEELLALIQEIKSGNNITKNKNRIVNTHISNIKKSQMDNQMGDRRLSQAIKLLPMEILPQITSFVPYPGIYYFEIYRYDNSTESVINNGCYITRNNIYTIQANNEREAINIILKHKLLSDEMIQEIATSSLEDLIETHNIIIPDEQNYIDYYTNNQDLLTTQLWNPLPHEDKILYISDHIKSYNQDNEAWHPHWIFKLFKAQILK